MVAGDLQEGLYKNDVKIDWGDAFVKPFKLTVVILSKPFGMLGFRLRVLGCRLIGVMRLLSRC